MNTSLYQIIYLSKNNISNDDAIMKNEVSQILVSSRKNNARNDVTGALMFNERWFAQILEGAHDNIQNTFERIQCDDRHSDVTILDFSPITTRIFSNWSMAFLDADTTAYQEFNALTSKADIDVNLLNGNKIFQLAKEHLREAVA